VRKQALAEQIARGEYVVDPHAVAEAMLKAGEFRRASSTVLEAPEALERPPAGVEQDEPGAGADLA
jgi:Anti-sigma-28 factor, FlgM